MDKSWINEDGLRHPIDEAEFLAERNEMYNGWSSRDWSTSDRSLDSLDWTVVGFLREPQDGRLRKIEKDDVDVLVMVEDGRTGERFWFHIPKIMFDGWLKQAHIA